MKNIIKFFGLLTLICFSFFYTDKVMTIMKEKDPIMIKINQEKEIFETKPVNAIIEEDTIVPGIYGRSVLKEDSYKKMKTIGVYLEDYYIYKDIIPNISINNNYNKYIISGNKNKKEIAIIFIINNKTQLNRVENYIKKENINLNYFIEDKVLNNYTTEISKLKNREIYYYGEEGQYKEKRMIYNNNLINRISNNKAIYCLTKEKNNKVLNLCTKNKLYTILPNIIIKNNIYSEVKEKIENGSIILIDLNNINLTNLNHSIQYIKSKGLNIVYLKELLEENTNQTIEKK